MGKLYHTDEVKEALDEKLNGMVMKAVHDEDLTGGALGGAIMHIRMLQKFADEFIADLVKADEEYEAEMAAWRAKRDGTDS